MGESGRVLALVGADGAAPVSPGAALLEEMLAGWRRQQQARRLSARLIGERERVVRQFAGFTGCWPWQWSAAQAEAWVAAGGWERVDYPDVTVSKCFISITPFIAAC